MRRDEDRLLGLGVVGLESLRLATLGRVGEGRPGIALEFAREPGRKRITLVIAEVPDTVTSLWTLLKG